jgi:hypothetical protein
VFHIDIAKVDRDVAYIAMAVHICCKLLFPIFDLFFQTYVAIVFIWMLHMFHTYVVSIYLYVRYVLQWFQVQVLHLSGCFKSRSRIASSSSSSATSPRYLLLLLPAPAGHLNQRRRRALLPPPLFDVVDVQGDVAPWEARKTECGCKRLDARVQALAQVKRIIGSS